jgi:putative transposase
MAAPDLADEPVVVTCPLADPSFSVRVRDPKETDVKKSRFTEAQIIDVLREQEAGGTTGEVRRRHGSSPQTFYRRKAKYGGLEVSDAQKLKGLDDENRRLKKLLAESMLDVATSKDLLGKN